MQILQFQSILQIFSMPVLRERATQGGDYEMRNADAVLHNSSCLTSSFLCLPLSLQGLPSCFMLSLPEIPRS